MEIKDRTAMQEKALERMLLWIRNVDSKSQIVIAIDMALIGAMVKEVPALTVPSFLTFVLGILGAGISLFFCLRAAFPHTNGPASLIFFGKIMTLKEAEYRKAVLARTEDDYLDDLANQTYINAFIACRKYRMLKFAMYSMFVGMIPWTAAIFLLTQGVVK